MQVPLLDMKRYTKLLAGASWMAEYGDYSVYYSVYLLY
jgi:prolyl oligopeptidase